MPSISMFYGIIIYLYFKDNKQHKKPHIHVKYQEDEVIVAIPNGVITTAENGKNTFQKILILKNSIDAKIVKLNRKVEIGREFINFLYYKPIIKTSDVTEELGISLNKNVGSYGA